MFTALLVENRFQIVFVFVLKGSKTKTPGKNVFIVCELRPLDPDPDPERDPDPVDPDPALRTDFSRYSCTGVGANWTKLCAKTRF